MRAPHAKDALFNFATRGFNFATRKTNLDTPPTKQLYAYRAIHVPMSLDKSASLKIIFLASQSKHNMSHMRFPTMWYVQPAKAQTSLHIHAV